MGDVVEPKVNPFRAAAMKATREFATADGELVRVEVDVTRLVERGPVIVSSRRAQPRGQHYRYRGHVDPMEVWRVALEWIDALPNDYLQCETCTDVRAGHWRRLTTLLSQVPCIEVEQEG